MNLILTTRETIISKANEIFEKEYKYNVRYNLKYKIRRKLMI